MRWRSDTTRVARAGLLLVAVGLAGCSAAGSANGNPSASGSGPAWSDYLVARTGYSCVLGAPGTTWGAGQITDTHQVTRVIPGSRGTAVTIRQSWIREYDEGKADHSARDVRHILAPDGTHQIEQDPMDLGGATATFNGVETIPSIRDLRAGASRLSVLNVTITADDAKGRAYFRTLTSDGSQVLRYQLSVRAEAGTPQDLVGPSGPFPDLVPVHVVTVARAMNLNDTKDARNLEVVDRSRFGGVTDEFYARGIGLVRQSTGGGSVDLQKPCTG